VKSGQGLKTVSGDFFFACFGRKDDRKGESKEVRGTLIK
jgi:hypothetical protein